MMKRKVFAAFLAAVLTAMLLTACGGGGGMSGNGSSGGSGGTSASSPTMGEGPSADAEGGFSGGTDYGFNSSMDYDAPADLAPEAPAPGEDAASGDNDTRLQNAKMIYTANIEAETTDFEACASDLETLVDQVGGYLEYASTNSYSTGYRSASYTARVPAAQFKAFLNSVGKIGNVVYQDKSGENISEIYYDTESRLVTQKTKLERLQALLAKAENMEDIITIESAISETEYQVEQLTGTLRRYDALVDFSTVYISLREVSRLSEVETAPPTFSDQLGTAFNSSLTNFGDFLQSVALSVTYDWIWLLILAAIIAFAVYRLRKSNKKLTLPHLDRKDFQKPDKIIKPDDTKKPDDKTPKE